MSSFLSLFSLSHIWSELSRTLRRFTLSSVFIVIVTSLLFYIIHEGYMGDLWLKNLLMRIVVMGSVTFFLSTAVVLAYEQYESIGRLVRVLATGMVILFAGILFLTLENDPFGSIEGMTMIFLTFFGFIAFLYFSPFLGLWRGYRERGYVGYFYRITIILLMSVTVGAAVMILGSIALWSIDTLFGVSFDDAYEYLAVIAFCCIAPFFGLARIPDGESISDEQGSENIFFTFLVKYVGLPFITLYFIILYAYSLKVLMNFSDWPNGQISWMVIGFSVFGYLLYIFSYVIGEKADLIQKVRRYFPVIVIPQIAMLFYAIYLRIAQYDLTMNRYFVVVFGLWLLGISLHSALVKSQRLVIIPASLAVITLIISIGPWSVYSLPLHRQEARLIRDLTSAGIYHDGSITPLASYESIDSSLSSDIYEGIGYVCSFDDCQSIKTLFAHEITLIEQEKHTRWDASDMRYQKCIQESKGGCSRDEYTPELSRWEIQSTIAEKIKVRYSSSSSSIPQVLSFIRRDDTNDIFPLDVRGYERIMKIIVTPDDNKQYHRDGVVFDLIKGEGALEIGGNRVETYSLRNIEKTLLQFKGDTPSWDTITLTHEQMKHTLTGSVYDIDLYFQHINIPNPAYSGSSEIYTSVDGFALIRKK